MPKCRECAKNVGKERQVKKACGLKMLTQNRSASGKNITECLKNESVANHSAMGWTESAKWV